MVRTHTTNMETVQVQVHCTQTHTDTDKPIHSYCPRQTKSAQYLDGIGHLHTLDGLLFLWWQGGQEGYGIPLQHRDWHSHYHMSTSDLPEAMHIEFVATACLYFPGLLDLAL